MPVCLARDMRPHTTAWLAPLPPALVKYDEEVIVSPGSGNRGVAKTLSALRHPITWMIGAMAGCVIQFAS